MEGSCVGGYVTVEPGVHLYVEDLNPAGAKTIVWLHGWPLNHKQFEYQFDVLSRMGYRLVGIDWRGFGLSDKPSTGYDYDRLADDIHAVLEALQLSEAVLVGHSTGGAIAARYMARHGGHGVSKLVLLSAALPVGFTQDTASRFIAEAESDRPKMMRGITENFFFQSISEPFAQWFNQLGLQAAGWSTAAIAELLGRANLGADLHQIRVPTLIAHAIHDRVIPYTQAEQVHRTIAGSRLETFYYSGHGLFYEERDKFNQVLIEFTG